MLFITSRQYGAGINEQFVLDLENNSSGRGFFCCRRIKKGVQTQRKNGVA
jgi:predicted RNA-binding protein YlxR (DUF448 family)